MIDQRFLGTLVLFLDDDKFTGIRAFAVFMSTVGNVHVTGNQKLAFRAIGEGFESHNGYSMT